MKTLSVNEKYAIINILSQIMAADGIIDPGEEEYMDNVFNELGITISDLEDASAIDAIHAKSIINEMSASHKEYTRLLFLGMAKSDGYVDPREMAVIEKIFD